MSPARAAPVVIEGVTITHPDRVLYAEQGITKRDLAAYYVRMASRVLPQVAGRPLSLVRCPQGQGGTCFYQKHWTHTLPPGLEHVEITEASGEREPYITVRDAAGLVSLVQYGVLELHPWGAMANDLEHPDRAIFDLDPAPDVPWARVRRTALSLRALLGTCGLDAWVKTTGGKGLHVVLPLVPDLGWSDLHDFVRLVTARLLHEDPDGLVDVASKAARTGRIFVDYLRNGRGATAITAYGTRARPGAPIAMPVSWTELTRLTRADGVTVSTIDTWRRSHRQDPWGRMAKQPQRITEEVMAQLLSGPLGPPSVGAASGPPTRKSGRRRTR